LFEGDATDLERELLRAGREDRLSGRDRRAIWLGVAAQAAPLAAATPAVPAAAKVAGAKVIAGGAAAKATLVALVIGGASVGIVAGRRSAPAPTAPAAIEAPRAPAAPPAPPPPVDEVGPNVAERAPAAHAPRRAAASRLAAEGRAVLDARRALRDGRADEALRTLEAARAEYGAGALEQEREALTIEALARAGRRDLAAARAAAFLKAHPGSPHAATVRGFAAP
jgi:hypothetical protein